MLRPGLLLFASGFCAIVYQLTWMKYFRLVFGASATSCAAVTAVFMGGLGLGGLVLGRRAEQSRRPLRFYGLLEGGIALFSLAVPCLVDLARKSYTSLGGPFGLGGPGATLFRILATAAVLGAPTLLMGGTLPAMVRHVRSDRDEGRSRVGILYGMNTLGAVCGAFLAGFVLLEALGSFKTILAAVVLNAAAAAYALHLSSDADEIPAERRGYTAGQARSSKVSPSTDSRPASTSTSDVMHFAELTTFLCGFTFFLMELVWYRMLIPILGGTTYTFSVILGVTLAGIGAGGLLYGRLARNRTFGARAFAISCSVEAFFLCLPLALGDRIPLFLASIPIPDFGLPLRCLAWSAAAAVVVAPAAICSGFQFPLLIAIHSRCSSGGTACATGRIYAFNTAGAIAGSLAGGFLLLPRLSAPGCWHLSAVLLAGLTLCSFFFLPVKTVGAQQASNPVRRTVTTLATLLPAVMGLAFCFACDGPTAFWRHGGVGTYRVYFRNPSVNIVKAALHSVRRRLKWERDGKEACIGIMESEWGNTFYTNGKCDGAARSDANSQVMFSLLAALLHPAPRRAFIVGFGTGSSAGWMAAVPGIRRVDVAELEGRICEAAPFFGHVNRDPFGNPKVHVHVFDGRAVLQTIGREYDVIASAPSNPYRAGIASLYTVEFYRSVAARLAKGGIFAQWFQCYELAPRAEASIFTTLREVFEHVELWQSQSNSGVVLCSRSPLPHDLDLIGRRIAESPYREALATTWRVSTVEGLLSRYTAGGKTLDVLASQGVINTDDSTIFEYEAARTVGMKTPLTLARIFRAAVRLGDGLPALTGGKIDRDAVFAFRPGIYASEGAKPDPLCAVDEGARTRVAFYRAYLDGDYGSALAAWRKAEVPGRMETLDMLMLAHVLAATGSSELPSVLKDLLPVHMIEALVFKAIYQARRGLLDRAASTLCAAFIRCRTNPWPYIKVIEDGCELARCIARNRRQLAQRLYRVLSTPFADGICDTWRKATLLDIGSRLGTDEALRALAVFEPHVPWSRVFLQLRFDIYHAAGHPLEGKARADLAEFIGVDGSSPVPRPLPLLPGGTRGKAGARTGNSPAPLRPEHEMGDMLGPRALDRSSTGN